MSDRAGERRVSVRDLFDMKQRGDRIAALTAYDFLFARLVDECGADIVLVGVSRVGKTPLSMYLAQRGLRTGNVPILAGIEPPRELLAVDPEKVVGLLADPQVQRYVTGTV